MDHRDTSAEVPATERGAGVDDQPPEERSQPASLDHTRAVNAVRRMTAAVTLSGVVIVVATVIILL